jgi:hypothetical protein
MELIPLTEVRYHRSCDINYHQQPNGGGGNVTINPTTGTVVVPENTAGSYTIVYQICDKLTLLIAIPQR